MRLSPSVGIKEPDLFRLEFRDETLRGCLEQIVSEKFHDFELSHRQELGKSLQ